MITKLQVVGYGTLDRRDHNRKNCIRHSEILKQHERQVYKVKDL